jgi:hypothetical protein
VHIKPLTLALFILLLALVPACGAAETPPTPAPTDTTAPANTAEPTESGPTPTAAPGEPTPLPAYEAPPLPTERSAFFAASGVCASCHNNLTDEAGNDVSIDTNWRPSMMANASRDPYWQASVRSEVIDHPQLKSVIEDKCATCHTSMARFTAVVSGTESALLDEGFMDPDNPYHTFAIDGVSCTLCHQIEEEGLGDPESFSGNFPIDTERPRGERLIYGPFPPVEEPATLMQDVSDFLPVEGPQTLRSELCATCHTLYTPYVDEEGEVAGTFPEQVPYLEWQHSDYADDTSCQDCHMPPAEGAVDIASTGGGPPRSPFAQHLFIGGNTYVLKMLWAFGEEIGVTASSDHFASKVEQTLDQLQDRTATVSVDNVSVADARLAFDVAVQTRTGHKFPSGFPARRAWLHVTVADGAGTIVFESGAVATDGAIAGNDNDVDPATYEPHYEEITAEDQVQIYEPILENVSGEMTTGLIQAMGYRKDNRLLPSGFDKGSAGNDFAVYGGAAEDDDFVGGGDTVRYRVDLGEADGELTVTIELLYQSIGYRWAENLRRHEDAAEVTRFLDRYDALPNQPITVAAATATATP